jgi:hypothetical protein
MRAAASGRAVVAVPEVLARVAVRQVPVARPERVSVAQLVDQPGPARRPRNLGVGGIFLRTAPGMSPQDFAVKTGIDGPGPVETQPQD